MSADGMKVIAVYADSGEILRIVRCAPSQCPYQPKGGEGVLRVAEGVADDTHYIRDDQAVEKSALSPTITTEGMGATISGLPSGLTVLWDGEEGVTDGDPLELDHDEPGTYTLRILGGAPYFGTSIEVTLG